MTLLNTPLLILILAAGYLLAIYLLLLAAQRMRRLPTLSTGKQLDRSTPTR